MELIILTSTFFVSASMFKALKAFFAPEYDVVAIALDCIRSITNATFELFLAFSNLVKTIYSQNNFSVFISSLEGSPLLPRAPAKS